MSDTELNSETRDTELSVEPTVAVPDLSDLLMSVDFDSKPLSYDLELEDQFGVHKWGSLAIELIALPLHHDEIIKKYGLSDTQFALLMENKLFKEVYKETESSISALVANGAFQLNARRLAEQGLAVLREVMRHGNYGEKLNAVKMAALYAGLDPSLHKKDKDVQVNTGVQLVVNFSGSLPTPSAFKDKNVIIEAVADEVE